MDAKCESFRTLDNGSVERMAMVDTADTDIAHGWAGRD